MNFGPMEQRNSLRRRIYFAARDGLPLTLYSLLSEIQSDPESFLNNPVEEDGQNCSPYIVACLQGHNDVVKMLLQNYKIDIEQKAIVQLSNFIVEGATGLWCAAGAGHLEVVRTLVNHGANVNQSTSAYSTPLRAACFDGRLEIVKYLVENCADPSIANKYNNTCLMICAYRGHLDVVHYFLGLNINVDARANCGATALHFAAQHGHLSIVKELLKHGAKILKNNIGMTPLMVAAEQTKSDVVEYLVRMPWFTKEAAVEALELLGASYANDKDHYSLEKAYYYLEWAMRKRQEYNCSKPKTPATPAYDNHVECQTLEDLQSIKYDSNALHMESLAIRERILGVENPEVPHPVIFRGAVFADVGRFDKCVTLWLHALNLRFINKVGVWKDLLRFAQVYSQMLHIGDDIPYVFIERVLSIATCELERNKSSQFVTEQEESYQTTLEEMEDNIQTVLYLLVITTKLIKKFSPEEEHKLYQLVYRINRLQLSTLNGSTLLHLSVNTATPVDNFHTKHICKFPCAATTRMLIQCGADVNSVDEAGNTPLHIIVAYQKPITDFMTLHSIINQLIEAGAHMDCVNDNGETPLDAVLTGVAEIILKARFSMSLKCIAAKAVRKFNLGYDMQTIPWSLVAFTDMHGFPRKKVKNLKG